MGVHGSFSSKLIPETVGHNYGLWSVYFSETVTLLDDNYNII
jgi:hypothetical protein